MYIPFDFTKFNQVTYLQSLTYSMPSGLSQPLPFWYLLWLAMIYTTNILIWSQHKSNDASSKVWCHFLASCHHIFSHENIRHCNWNQNNSSWQHNLQNCLLKWSSYQLAKYLTHSLFAIKRLIKKNIKLSKGILIYILK